MNEERLLTILLAPHVSEKTAYSAGEGRQYAFKVIRNATKPEIKAAIKLLFNVEAGSVTTVNSKGKPTRFGRTEGRRKDWKKAYVTLVPGQEIDAAGK